MATAFSIDRFLTAPPITRAREIERGLPVAALRDVLADEVVTLADLVGIVGKRRTLDRRLAEDDTLTLEESDRLIRFAEVLAQAEQIVGGRREAMEWLRKPKRRLEDARPIDLLRTHSGTELVTNLLNLAKHGMLA